jgi:translation initiation factor 1
MAGCYLNVSADKRHQDLRQISAMNEPKKNLPQDLDPCQAGRAKPALNLGDLSRLFCGDGGTSGATALVYSTRDGRRCPQCSAALTQCRCKKSRADRVSPIPNDGQVRVSREAKGRGGKAVSLVKGLPLEGDALVALAKQLKASCGSGGTVKDAVIEIQGDHVDRLVELLKTQGFKVKRAGG